MHDKVLSKVARITLLFWLMKVVATTLGETLGDFISMTLNLGYSVGIAITFVFFILVLVTQLCTKHYIPYVYWLVIVGTTTLGTEISDWIDRTLHLGYIAGSIVLVVLLIAALFIWFKKFGDLKVYPILTPGKELYYWIAILFSNSLGTAFGDYLTDNLELSYMHGALITGGIILCVAALHYLTRINDVLLFWIAFVFTRPFGATFGDFLTKPVSKGGLNLGTLASSLVAIAILTLFIILEHQQEDKRRKATT